MPDTRSLIVNPKSRISSNKPIHNIHKDLHSSRKDQRDSKDLRKNKYRMGPCWGFRSSHFSFYLFDRPYSHLPIPRKTGMKQPIHIKGLRVDHYRFASLHI